VSNLVVITFDDAEQASQVKESLKNLQKQGLLKIDDMAVVVKDAEGKVHTDNQLDTGVKTGIVGGSLLGLLVAGIFAPLGGLVLGGALGGLVGALFDKGIPKSFVKDVSNDLQPNTSAIFIIAKESNANAVAATLRQYQGSVYQTTLPSDLEDQLREALK
jgi:uncharacterized membrane protein